MTSDTSTAAVIVAIYATEDDTKAALRQLEDMQKQGLIELIEAASVTKDDAGKIHVTDTADVGTGKGTKRGAVIGGVVGLIFPPSIIVGALAGGGIGALYGHFRDKGINNKELADAGNELQPGQSGLIAVVVDKFVDQVAKGIEGYEKLNKTLLDAQASAAVLAETNPA